MKLLLNSSLILLAMMGLAAGRPPIESALLDERVVYVVPVATNRVTTISFPGPIAALDAAGVTTDAKVPGRFQLAHTRGSSFFSVRAVAPGASANVNVRWGKHTYVIELVESASPVLSLVLESKPQGARVQPAPRLTPTKLLALLDKAKAFPLLKAQQPESVREVDFVTFTEKQNVSDFGDYEIRIEEAFRFNPEDTLVFHLTLRNRIGSVIHYRPDSLKLRIGNRIYHQSITDAAGIIPPHSDTTAYFAVTGTPDGARNEISLQNEFRVLIERLPEPVVPVLSTNSPSVTP